LKKAVRYITIFLLAANVLVASTGLSVHHLYCYCKGKTIASLFHIDDPCEMAPAQPATGCCQKGKCKSSQGDKHDCNSGCNSDYVKLDADYLVFSSEFKLSAPAVSLSPLFLKKWENTAEGTVHLFYTDPSPPLTGKERLPFLQTYLC
jgi:hypothetical protein